MSARKYVTATIALSAILSLTSCSLGYVVYDSELENRRFHLARGQEVAERNATGALSPVTIDAPVTGVAYLVNDSIYFDDTASQRTLVLIPTKKNDASKLSVLRLSRTSLEADVITIPLRYRFQRGSVGGTMPESTNLAMYAGVRFENYKLNFRRYREATTRENRRVGYGAGVFVGVTPVAVGAETDLPALMLGLGAMLDVGGVSFGVAAGFDKLLHAHHDEWHYEGALWTGLWLGLKLN